MTRAPYVYNAAVVSVIDGDTVGMVIDRGMYDYAGSLAHPIPVRLDGCNAREHEQPGGPEATANLASILRPGVEVVLSTVKPDKYAPRWLARVALDGIPDLTTRLIADGWAAAWDGRGTKPTPAWPRNPA